MARHLTQITAPLKEYLTTRFINQWRLAKSINIADIEKLPAPLFIAQMRGDAILKHELFTTLEQKQISDPVSQQYAWQQLLTSGNCLQEVMENSGATTFFHLNTEKDYAKQCYNAYCIILWDATVNNNKLQNNLTSGLVNHYLPTLYPSKAKDKTPEQLKKDIAKSLAQQWHLKPEIKESFITTEEGVTFSITAKAKGYSTTTLTTVNGKRLNITRNKAYNTCLKQVQSTTIPLPNALTALKQQTPKPF
jgi:hypothetical protein